MAKKQFKAESKRLLDLMINSIYTHKEIFLREIISNASDAIDKLCYTALTDSGTGLARGDFFIRIDRDEKKRILTVTDNGIGMSKEDLESNLGVIARSGSLQFKNEMENTAEDIDIIGQFGVGFYSAFMVSDKITVITRKYGSEEAWKWQSSGADGYTITACEKETQGTEIIMEIKADTEDESYSRFLEEYNLVSLVKKYSDYIRYPVQMERERRRNLNEGQEGKEPEWETYYELETLNSMVPIWQRNKNEVSDEDLNQFYKEKFFDFEDPLKAIHVDAEGTVSYKALLFIPQKASYDYYTKEYKRGLQLYSSGVLIMDHCEELVPEHFRFVRGVVDTPDISLNISREMLQHTRQLKVVASNIEKKVKSELLKMLKNERETYETFFDAFGRQLKYGVLSEYGMHKDQLKDLLLYSSSAGDEKTTLEEYVGRMKEDQKSIYYAAGQSIPLIATLPQAERIREKGYEILYFTEEVDEFVAQTLQSYDEKPIRSISADDPDLETEEEKQEHKKQQDDSKDLLEFMKGVLGDAVKEVKISQKLRNTPACLTAEGPVSFEMEKYLNQVQPDGNARAERVLEINLKSPVLEKLCELQNTDNEKAEQYTKILFYQAEMMAGLPVSDPAAYSELVFGLM
ncbi:MAG: molecular chaperone HtpG [Christensenellaceae bacterium]